MALTERDARGRFVSKRMGAATAMMDYIKDNPPPRINRIGPLPPPETMTIKEYSDRYLRPANDRAREDMLRQWREDAAWYGWQPTPFWKRMLRRLGLWPSAPPSEWTRKVAAAKSDGAITPYDPITGDPI